ncbi:MAG: hypothetical protein VX938_10005, partial [Myxococcota bacterium]|nr:hypothetical protein [Myxococcota bacterium]
AAPTGCESDADCDDGDPCTVGEACSDGACVEGAPRSCDDENPCTDDTCDPVVADGCVHIPTEAACDDGDPCTEGDACDEGACVPGEAKSCDDGDPCNGVEACGGDGECLVGEPMNCDDQDPCTTDACDSETGACSSDPVVCGDNSVCVEGTCEDMVCEPYKNYCMPDTDASAFCNANGTGPDGDEVTNCKDPAFAGIYAANWACIPDTGTCGCVPTCEEGACGGEDGCGGICGCKPGIYCKVDSEFDVAAPGAMANVTGECTDLSGLCDVDGETYCEGDTAYACAKVPALPPGPQPPGMVDAAEMLVAQIVIDCPTAQGEFHVCAENSEGFAECITCGDGGCPNGWKCEFGPDGEPACVVGPDCEPKCADSDLACGDDGCGGVCGDETCGSETKVCAPLVEGAPSICQDMA